MMWLSIFLEKARWTFIWTDSQAHHKSLAWAATVQLWWFQESYNFTLDSRQCTACIYYVIIDWCGVVGTLSKARSITFTSTLNSFYESLDCGIIVYISRKWFKRSSEEVDLLPLDIYFWGHGDVLSRGDQFAEICLPGPQIGGKGSGGSHLVLASPILFVVQDNDCVCLSWTNWNKPSPQCPGVSHAKLCDDVIVHHCPVIREYVHRRSNNFRL